MKTICPNCDAGNVTRESLGYMQNNSALGVDLWRPCDRSCRDGRLKLSREEFEQADENVRGAEIHYEDEDEVQVVCPDCEGQGGRDERCFRCGEPIEEFDYFLVGDGEILCDDCGPSTECPKCQGTGEIEHKGVYLQRSGEERKFFKALPVGSDCSMCGGQAHEAGPRDQDRPWFVYRGAMLDEDGVYFARLCGDERGNGCLSDIFEIQPNLSAEARENLSTLVALMPDELDDGVQTTVEDMPDFFR